MNTTVVKVADLSNNMKLDEELGIIAAGPVVSLNCGLLGSRLVRAVLRTTKDGFSLGYVVSIQRVDDDGRHHSFDSVADKPFDNYVKATKGFRNMMRTVDDLGYGYHDYTSS